MFPIWRDGSLKKGAKRDPTRRSRFVIPGAAGIRRLADHDLLHGSHRSPFAGVLMVSRPLPDVTPTTTHMLEVLLSSRLSFTLIDTTRAGFLSCTTASTSCGPPPLSRLAVALEGHFRNCAAISVLQALSCALPCRRWPTVSSMLDPGESNLELD